MNFRYQIGKETAYVALRGRHHPISLAPVLQNTITSIFLKNSMTITNNCFFKNFSGISFHAWEQKSQVLYGIAFPA
jgi:hypothetical protein